VDWLKLVENSAGPLVGSFAGAAAALSSLWLKEHLDRKRQIQEWFEQEYVFGGIDLLVELLQRWKHMISHKESQRFLNVDFSSLPHLTITRLSSLIRTMSLETHFYVLAGVVQLIGVDVLPAERRLIDWGRIIDEVHFLEETLMDLQFALLTVTIHTKSEIKIIHKLEQVANIRDRLEKHIAIWKDGNDTFKLKSEDAE
jgi:hypothetical protein